MKSLWWMGSAGAAVLAMCCPAWALPPCASNNQSPRVLVPGLNRSAVNEVTAFLPVRVVASAGEDIDRIDLFIGETAVAVAKKGENLQLMNPPQADFVEYTFNVDVAMSPSVGRLAMAPGSNWLHIYATTASGKCGKIDVQVKATQPRVFAVVVGVDAPNSQLDRLHYASADAAAFKEYLEKDLSVPPEHITFLPDPNRPADATTIGEELERLQDLNVEADTVFFFFAGHGVLKDGEQYLVPMRGNLRHPKSTLLKLGDVQDYLKASKARRRVFFIDACNVGEGEGQRGVGQPESGRRGPNETLTSFWSKWSGSFGITSSEPTESSYEHKSIEGGVFTHFLLEAFRKAEADQKHKVTLMAVYNYVKDNVPKFARQRLDPAIEEQHPYLIDNSGEAGQIEIGYH